MAEPIKIRVMISSRSASKVFDPGVRLEELRTRLRSDLEAQELCGEPLFDVWIHEQSEAVSARENVWEESLRMIRWADVLFVLYNGEAGSAGEGQDLGICRAELQEALNTAPGKVRILRLLPLGGVAKRDREFQGWMEERKLPAKDIHDEEDLTREVHRALRAAVAELARAGVERRRGGSYDQGDALSWSRLSFEARKSALEGALRDALVRLGGAERDGATLVPIRNENVLVVCHGIPAPLSVPAARELVGQPFLHDHRHASDVKKPLLGPVHLVACHRGVTEAQALRQLGFPDATIVPTAFGIYVADEVQKIQMVFLSRCRDATATRMRVEQLSVWLSETEEAARLVERARGRGRIARAIAREQDSGTRA